MSSAPKHVPGPWHWGEDGGAIYAEVDGVDRRVASVPVPYWISEHDRETALKVRTATADLVSAAPDLLEALEATINSAETSGYGHPFNLRYHDCCGTECPVVRARAALAKARGGT